MVPHRSVNLYFPLNTCVAAYQDVKAVGGFATVEAEVRQFGEHENYLDANEAPLPWPQAAPTV
jgi:hypothetical protein